MFTIVLLAAFQIANSPTGIPVGADIKTLGKIRPNNYFAIPDYRLLPFVADMPASKKLNFTGTVITLDHPQRGMIHVMNYKDGKRVVLDNPKSIIKENGVPLTKMMASLPPKVDARYASSGGASFGVKLPGEEKRLLGFSGTLTAFLTKPVSQGISIIIVNGKVKSSTWLKSPAPHK